MIQFARAVFSENVVSRARLSSLARETTENGLYIYMYATVQHSC